MVIQMKILVVDIPASETGALTILQDFFYYVEKSNTMHKWFFLISTDTINTKNRNITIIKKSYPKKNWLYRIIWEIFHARFTVKKIKPDLILSLQNTTILGTKNTPGCFTCIHRFHTQI